MSDFDRYDGLPATWSPSARETYAATVEEYALDAPTTAGLYQACELVARADALEERIATDGPVVTGSTGQPVAHPLLAEARLARTAAMQSLRSVRAAATTSSRTSARMSALASSRHHSRTPGRRSA